MILRLRAALDSSPFPKRPTPTCERMELTLVLTHACNLGCSYCYVGAKDARAMPEAVARRALDVQSLDLANY